MRKDFRQGENSFFGPFDLRGQSVIKDHPCTQRLSGREPGDLEYADCHHDVGNLWSDPTDFMSDCL